MKVLRSRIATIKPRKLVSLPSTDQPRYGSGRGGRPWRRLRSNILHRDGHLCQPCWRRGDLTLAKEVDHIVPVFEGGTDAEFNLQSICKDCHGVKTQAEATRARMRSGGRD